MWNMITVMTVAGCFLWKKLLIEISVLGALALGWWLLFVLLNNLVDWCHSVRRGWNNPGVFARGMAAGVYVTTQTVKVILLVCAVVMLALILCAFALVFWNAHYIC